MRDRADLGARLRGGEGIGAIEQDWLKRGRVARDARPVAVPSGARSNARAPRNRERPSAR